MRLTLGALCFVIWMMAVSWLDDWEEPKQPTTITLEFSLLAVVFLDDEQVTNEEFVKLNNRGYKVVKATFTPDGRVHILRLSKVPLTAEPIAAPKEKK